MISLRRLRREDWERQLRDIGCEPLDGVGPLNTAEWWRYPWPPRLPFTVPVDQYGYADVWGFQLIQANIAKQAPPGWEFPEPDDS